MSDAKRSDSERRDPTLARLLAEALHAPGASGGAAGDSACPDAELLAAYADQGLGAEETAHWESHFAGCARCQQILVVLTASGEEPLTDAELEQFGRLAATASIPAERRSAREEKKIVTPFPPRTTWRWLAPAAGIAAAAALWFALRPSPPRGTAVITAEKTTAEPSAAQNESQIAQANAPPPPVTRQGEEQAPPPAAGNSRAVPAPRGAEKKEEQAATQAQGAPSAPPAALETNRAAPPTQLQGNPPAEASSALKAPAAKANGAAAATTGTVTEAAPVGVAGGVGRGVGPGTPAAPPNGERSVQAFAARNQIAGLAKIAPPIVFASPDRSALWRVGVAGRIERSADQGQTWQQQASGVTADLLAGAAPSNKIAWVAGRAGVILRTTDGEHWQRVASPERPVNGRIGGRLDSAAVAADWTGVEASDALHATVISAGRRLVTEDGGQTWKQH
jgi:hypothetical protein